jgi:phosphoribosylanthranilate isomerase
MWIKICGLTSAEAVTAALEHWRRCAGVRVRRVGAPRDARAGRTAQPARPRPRAPALQCAQPSQRLRDEVLAVFRPDVLQSDAADLATLRLPQTLALLPVLRGAPAASVPLPPRLLFEGARSGSGRTADWGAAQALAQRTQLVLAGGLTPGNVGEAIAAVRPFGVDVSSGVEERPGLKSPAAIGDFVQAVRAAARAMGTTADPL